MAPLPTHAFHIDFEEVGNKVAEAAWDLNHVAACQNGAGEWRSQVRKLAEDQRAILRRLHEIESEFTESLRKE